MGEPVLDLSEILDLYKEDARRMAAQDERGLGAMGGEVQAGGAARQELRRLSHQLRGILGRTYGFREVTRISKALENIMLKLEKRQAACGSQGSKKRSGKKSSCLAGGF